MITEQEIRAAIGEGILEAVRQYVDARLEAIEHRLDALEEARDYPKDQSRAAHTLF